MAWRQKLFAIGVCCFVTSILIVIAGELNSKFVETASVSTVVWASYCGFTTALAAFVFAWFGAGRSRWALVVFSTGELYFWLSAILLEVQLH